jgi:hypothetical protein
MTPMNRALVILIVAPTLMLAACGGSGDGRRADACGDGLCEPDELSCATDCGARLDGGATCLWRDVRYEPGVSFPAGDGCNVCTCGGDGTIGCTEADCSSSEGCRTDADCSHLPSGYCAAPGPVTGGCGVGCPLLECTGHDGCAAAEVCHRGGFRRLNECCGWWGVAAGLCAAPCDASFDCGEGMRCATDGACEPHPCTDGFACPSGTICDPADGGADVNGCAPVSCTDGYACSYHTTCDRTSAGADGHGCVRRACTDDSSCASGGYCVQGACYVEPGTCEQPAA